VAVWGAAFAGVYLWNRHDEKSGGSGLLGALGLERSSSGEQNEVFSQAEMDKWNNTKRENRGREWEKAEHAMKKNEKKVNKKD
jgi:hypothetical protein